MVLSKAKRKAAELENTAVNRTTFANSDSVKRVHFTVTSNSGSSKSTSVIGPDPRTLQPPPVTARPPPTVGQSAIVEPVAEKKRTQNAEILDDFGDHFEALGSLLLDLESNPLVEDPCPCGRLGMKADTHCYDCTGYRIACKSCFLDSHLRNPFHWAEVWDPMRGFFIRHDISKLGHVIQLGHNGAACPSPCGESGFTIVDDNGVHSTRLSFCGCHELPPNKVKQLMQSQLFPATTRGPETAFTFNMLKRFQLHNLESKKAAYDYLGAIRRLTDNAFTADVANPYAAFLRVVRVFNYLTLKKRTGQFHNIDQFLPHRPAGNLLVWCPACPEPGFNSDPNCPTTPAHLRHLNQSQRTLDGNFQCNQFNKNTDPDDVSLCAGKGYFPLDSDYKEYLARVPVSKEVTQLLHHVSFQFTEPFLPEINLFANTDCALAEELKQHQPNESFKVTLRVEVDDVDQVTTYDIACEYFIHLEERFEKQFPELLPMIKRMRWGVPALHVQGHQDSCTYLFGTAYMECVGHFHGETAEQYWPEANQLGPHVRQMNNGHRQDTMINHHGDWNHKKTMNLPASLAEDIADAKRKYIEKRNHFIGLSVSFSDRVQKWNKMPRTSTRQGKEAVSVYKHSTTKVPSQTAIYQKMLNDESAFGPTMVPRSKVARFLDEGFRIQDLHATEEHDLVSRQKEINIRTAKAQARIDSWRKLQKELMPNVGNSVALQAQKKPAVQDETLFMPSDFPSEAERNALGLRDLALEEAKWREGEMFDHLRALQNIVKTISALRNRKIRDDRQQKDNTRAGDNIRVSLALRDEHMESYEVARKALLILQSDSRFLPLTEQDLYMKSVQQKRRVGDSRHTDGALWRINAETPVEVDVDDDNGAIRTSKPTGAKKPGVDPRPAGWLWQLGRLSKMSDAEMEEWSQEGDRVQWFRAEAEMQRWQEQGEQKLAEILRTNRSFQRMERTWAALAATALPPGHQAYARQKAAMYKKRAEQAQKFIKKAGYHDLLAEDASIIRRVQMDRDAEASVIAAAISNSK
ncbi:hypothetical protein C8R46DRAFT_1322335 [Mycena filopes]|nr:hypothetical protein C8R46DRAFT_1322335 [Mycena filopes]